MSQFSPIKVFEIMLFSRKIVPVFTRLCPFITLPPKIVTPFSTCAVKSICVDCGNKIFTPFRCKSDTILSRKTSLATDNVLLSKTA